MPAYLFVFLAAAKYSGGSPTSSGSDDTSGSDDGLYAEDQFSGAGDPEPTATFDEYAKLPEPTPVFLNIEISESSATEQVEKKLEAKIHDGWWDIGKSLREAVARHVVGKDGGAQVMKGVATGVLESLPSQVAAKGLHLLAQEEQGALGSDRASLGVLRLVLDGINLPRLGVVDTLRTGLKEKLGAQLNDGDTGMDAEVEVTADAAAQGAYWRRVTGGPPGFPGLCVPTSTQSCAWTANDYAPLEVSEAMVAMSPTSACAPMTTAHSTAESIFVNILVKNAEDLVRAKVDETWLPPLMKKLVVHNKVSDGGTTVTAGLAAKMVPVLEKQLTDEGFCVDIKTLSDAACVSKQVGLDGAGDADCARVSAPTPSTCENANCNYAAGVLGSVGPLVVFRITVFGLDIAKMGLIKTIVGQIEGSLATTFAAKGLAAAVTAEIGEDAQRAWLAGDTEDADDAGTALDALDALNNLDEPEVAAPPKRPPLTRREPTAALFVDAAGDLPVPAQTALDARRAALDAAKGTLDAVDAAWTSSSTAASAYGDSNKLE